MTIDEVRAPCAVKNCTTMHQYRTMVRLIISCGEGRVFEIDLPICADHQHKLRHPVQPALTVTRPTVNADIQVADEEA